MTQAELAQMAPMMGDGYNNPLEMSALTQGNMGYLPNAQMMTPSSMGAFRTLPDMAYQQPVNQQAGYLKSLGTAALSSYGFNYNPAVNPLLQRIEAERLVHDTNASTKGAAGATVLDFALPAIAGYIGKGLKMFGKVPLVGGLASGIGGMMMPLTIMAQMASSLLGFEGVQDKIANTRALQRLTRGKIVSGNSMDEGMMSGFSTKAAREIDKHLYRTGLMDGVYDQEDYRRMMSEGIQAGLFDYANTPEQYKKTLRNIRDNMSTVMEVTGSQEFTDVMKQLKRLQDMGATQQEYKSILRKENMYARITGLSHEDLVNTYGQMGALEFNQRGLNQAAGSLVGMANAATVTMMQRNGQISATTLASKGGISGFAQEMTSQEAESRAEREKELALAFYDTETGGVRKDAKELMQKAFSMKGDGLLFLKKLAQDNALKIRRGGVQAEQMYRTHYADNVNTIWNTTAASPEQLNGMLSMILGYSRLGNNASKRDAFIMGERGSGKSALSAEASYIGLQNKEAQAANEELLAQGRKQTDYDKRYNFFSRFVRGIKETVVSPVDNAINLYTDSELSDSDSIKLRYARGINANVSSIIANREAAKDKKAQIEAITRDIVNKQKGSSLLLGDKVEGFDMTPILLGVAGQLVKSVNKALNSKFYSSAFEKALHNSSDGASVLRNIDKLGEIEAKAMTAKTKSKKGDVYFDKNKKVIGFSTETGKVNTIDGNGKQITVTDEEFKKAHEGEEGIVSKNLEDANIQSGGGDYSTMNIFGDSSEKPSVLNPHGMSVTDTIVPVTGLHGEVATQDTPGVWNPNNPYKNSSDTTAEQKSVEDSFNAALDSNYLTMQYRQKRGTKELYNEIVAAYKKEGVSIGPYEDFEKFLEENLDEVTNVSPEKFSNNALNLVAAFADRTGKDANGKQVDADTLDKANRAIYDGDQKGVLPSINALVLSNEKVKNTQVAKDIEKSKALPNVGIELNALRKDIVTDKKQEAAYKIISAVENNSADTNLTNAEASINEAAGVDINYANPESFDEVLKKYEITKDTTWDIIKKYRLPGITKDWLAAAKDENGNQQLTEEQIEKLAKDPAVQDKVFTAILSRLGTDSQAFTDYKQETRSNDTMGNTLARKSKEIEDITNFVSKSVADSETQGKVKTHTQTALKQGADVKTVGFADAVAAVRKVGLNAFTKEDEEHRNELIDTVGQTFNLSEEDMKTLRAVGNGKELPKKEELLKLFKNNPAVLKYFTETVDILKDGQYNRSGLSAVKKGIQNISSVSKGYDDLQWKNAAHVFTQAGFSVRNGNAVIPMAAFNASALSDENKELISKRQAGDHVTLPINVAREMINALPAAQRVVEQQKRAPNILEESTAPGTAIQQVAAPSGKELKDAFATVNNNTGAMVTALNSIKTNTDTTGKNLGDLAKAMADHNAKQARGAQ